MDCVDLQGTANPQAQHERKRYFPRALHPFENYGLVQQTVQIVVRSSHNLTLFVRFGFSYRRYSRDRIIQYKSRIQNTVTIPTTLSSIGSLSKSVIIPPRKSLCD